MSDLAAWLLEQIDLDAEQWNAHNLDCRLLIAGAGTGWCDCGGPGRWVAECEAKRRAIALHSGPVGARHSCPGADDAHASWTPGAVYWVGVEEGEVKQPECTTLRLLALPYADRPGYLEEWRP